VTYKFHICQIWKASEVGSTIQFDDKSAKIAGKIRYEMQKQGTPIGPYDVFLTSDN